MNYSRKGIYTVARNAIKTSFPDANVTGTYVPMPSSFPAVFIREIGHITPPNVVSLTNADDMYESTFEIQVWTKGETKMDDAYKILEVAKTAFKKLYFVQTSEIVVDDGTNSTLFRLTANFRRVIGGGEQMPT